MEDQEGDWTDGADGDSADAAADRSPTSIVAFKKETDLQRLIMDSPSLLPGVDDDDAKCAVAKEVSIPREGPADVVVVDSKGTITLVECKRAKNPETRRWVIGQLLGYAAWLWKLDYKNFKLRFEKSGGDLTKFESVPDFRDTVSKNLADGRFQLIIAADSINEWLKRAVVFLNSHTSPEVGCLAVSINAATGQVTGVFGRESSEAWPYRPSWKGPRKKILNGIQDVDAARAAAGLLRWAADRQPQVKIDFKPKTRRGVVKTTCGRTLFRIEEYQDVRASFHALHRDEERIKQLRADLTAIDPRFEGGDRPRAPLVALADESKRARFLALMERSLRAAINS